MYLITEEKELIGKDIPITVHSFMYINTWNVGTKDNDTILSLKQFLSRLADCSSHEIILTLGQDYPYSLTDHLLIKDFLENHRIFHLIVKENPKKVIPKRLLRYEEKEERVVKCIDFTEMYKEDIEYIWHWIIYRNYHDCRIVYLDSEHPNFCEIMKEITESLYSSLDMDRIPNYPIHYFIKGGKNEDIYLKELRYFYKKLNEFNSFHRIRLYIGPGFFGDIKDTENQYILLTKENVKSVDLILSDFMWSYKE